VTEKVIPLTLVVIPAKAGIQSIHKEEWIPSQAGNVLCCLIHTMTKRDKEGMTKRVDSLLQGNDGRKTWIPDQVEDDKKRVGMAGMRTTGK